MLIEYEKYHQFSKIDILKEIAATYSVTLIRESGKSKDEE